MTKNFIHREKKSSTRLRKIVESEQLTFKVFVTELFYMSLTQTDMLIYLAILVNQVGKIKPTNFLKLTKN